MNRDKPTYDLKKLKKPSKNINQPESKNQH
jgi:hypothetical protein